MGIKERIGKATMHVIQAGNELVPLPKKFANQLDALAFMQTMAGYQTAAAVMAATRLELFSFLKEPQPLEAIAGHLNMTTEAARVLLDATAVAGLVREQASGARVRYVNTPVASKIFLGKRWSRTNRWASVRSMVDFMIGTWAQWADLAETMQKDKDDGHPLLKVYNPDNPMIGNYIETTTTLLAGPAEEVVRALDLSHVKNMICGVVGVSCAAEVIRQYPQVELTISCLDQLLRHLPEALEAYDCKEPREIICNTGDATTDRWGEVENYELVFLIRKFAYCGPQHGIDYLEKSRKVIGPGGYVIIWEPFVESFSMAPWLGATSALLDSMLGESHPLWRKSEVADFARQAGYEVSIFDCKKSTTSFVVARVPDN